MKAALFDLDGTLHDRKRGLNAFVHEQSARLNLPHYLQEKFAKRYIELDANGHVWKEQVYEQLIQEFQLSHEHTAQTLVQDYLNNYPLHASSIMGSRSALRKLRKLGVRIAIVTNGRSDLQRGVIHAIGMDTHVDTIVISEEIGIRKPDPKIFELAIQRLGVGQDNAVMVGDSISADIQGATRAGIETIYLGNDKTSEATYSAQSMNDALTSVVAILNLNLEQE